MLYPYRHKLPLWLWHIVLLLTFTDFACHAEVQVCGGNLTQPYGLITSPDYPKEYSGNLICVYIIRRPSGDRITLTFLDFCLEEATNCTYDYVEIRDGEASSSPLLGRRFCGASKPKDQRTSQNIMRITFKTDHSQTCRGFNASFMSDTTLVLVTTTKPSNIFYTDLTFRSFIKIPAANVSWPVGIGYDPVDDRIYWTDLDFKTRNIFSTFLNGTNTTLVRAFGNESEMESIAVDSLSRLLFYTDGKQKIIAVIAMSSLEHKVLINRDLKWPRDIALDTIHGVMFWTDQTWPKIERANYDGSDRRVLVQRLLIMPDGLALDFNNNHLYWSDENQVGRTDMSGNDPHIIFRSPSKSIFFYLALHDSHLYLVDWTSASSKTNVSHIIRITTNGTNPTTIFTSQSRMNSFRIYSTTTYPTGCEIHLFSRTGVISSPNPEKNYDSDLKCVYVIKQPAGYTITLNFSRFHLEDSSNCMADYVEIRDGESPTSPMLGGPYCGFISPPLQMTTQNAMRVAFNTNGNITFRGFKASFKSECGGNFIMSAGVISSPYHPNNYPNNLACEYVIKGPPGSKITLAFHDFNLEGKNCSSDYIEVRDGNSSVSPLLTERFCGDVMPPVLRTNQNIMRISFKTNSINVFQGFNASFNADCEIDFYGQRGVISSPNYPQDLASNLSCVYVIRQPIGYIVTLNFSDYCLETNASSTFLEFRDGESWSSPLIENPRCGDTTPFLRTSQNNMRIHFKSTEGGVSKGFKATFSAVETTTSAAEVTTSHGHHDITCTESRMEFSIPLSSPHTSETATLSDPNCQINVTRTHVRGGVDLNSCGTTVQFQNDSVIFRNAIIFSAPESSSLGSSGSNSSVSQYQDIIPIQCVYNRIATVHLSYMPVVRRVLFTESGVGQFSFNIQQFWDASFTNMVSDRAYPLRMELDADVFIQLSVGSEGQPVAGHKEIGMEVQQCLVSPSSSVIEAQLHYYPLIQDGCPASSDVHIIPNTNASDSTVMRFRFRAVNFFDPSSSSSSSLVFVHCRMGLCLTGSCKPSAWSCLTPPARRVRRDVDQSKRAAHQLSTGPFLIMADQASTSSSSTTATVMAVVSTSVATVAIVIAAIALIALRRRRTTAGN